MRWLPNVSTCCSVRVCLGGHCTAGSPVRPRARGRPRVADRHPAAGLSRPTQRSVDLLAPIPSPGRATGPQDRAVSGSESRASAAGGRAGRRSVQGSNINPYKTGARSHSFDPTGSWPRFAAKSQRTRDTCTAPSTSLVSSRTLAARQSSSLKLIHPLGGPRPRLGRRCQQSPTAWSGPPRMPPGACLPRPPHGGRRASRPRSPRPVSISMSPGRDLQPATH